MADLQPPGVVVHHVLASTKQYIGCPSIVKMPDGSYCASHSYFGHGARNTDSFIYRSDDGGASWTRLAEVHGQIWSNLFLHDGALYMMGTDHCDRYGGRLNGQVVIRRSEDGGVSWTEPSDASNGLLTDEEGYHTAPVPVVAHNGRLWRGMEFAPEPERMTWTAFVMSVDEGADLLRRENWQFSEQVQHLWSQSQWIEGNVVVDRDGKLVDVLRSNWRGNDTLAQEAMKDQAVMLHVSEDGKNLMHDREADVIDLPGGGVKFTIRFDPVSDRYWVLGNKQKAPEARRNRLVLASSSDLRSWEVHQTLLEHPDMEKHAFQYVDWIIDGEDIIFVSRTAYDDEAGGAHTAHDANYLTFHRVESFRNTLTA